MYRFECIVVLLFFYSLAFPQANRTVDGSFNNLEYEQQGSVGDLLSHLSPPQFEDGASEPTGLERPNPRMISNMLFSQSSSIDNGLNLSDYVWAFGQFVEHDILEVKADVFEPLFIEIPEGDDVFTPGEFLTMFRSESASGTGINSPRRYQNNTTAYIDASVVYGSDLNRARWLRTFEGGKLKTSSGDLLPWNTRDGEFNSELDLAAPIMLGSNRDNRKLFVAGDIRANETPLLLSIHTIFVREHNRLCDQFLLEDANLTDEELYQAARKMIGAYIQYITYYEWLPTLGIVMPFYSGYKPFINAQISNEFASASVYLWQSMMNSDVLRMTDEGNEINQGNLNMRAAVYNPLAINLAGGIEPYLRGMAQQKSQEMDLKVVDEIRNIVHPLDPFNNADEVAFKIMRGRERGLLDFNGLRKSIGLPEIKSFDEFTTDEVAQTLESLYGSVNDIDPWVGMLSEKHMPEAMIGNTFMHIVERQFQDLRDGDRFYFESDSYFSQDQLADIKNTAFQKIIMRNADINTMQEEVFKAADRESLPVGPDIQEISLAAAAFPNPSSGSYTIKVFEEIDAEVIINVYDNLGKLVFDQRENLTSGDNFISVVLPESSPAGIYHLSLSKEPVGSNSLILVKY